MIWYLLDTDAVIDSFKGFPSTVELIQRLYRQGAVLCLCDVVLAEVYAGLAPAERARGQKLLGALTFRPTSAEAARQAGLWRDEAARRGRQLATTDCLIAATAQAHDAALLTGNTSDYPMPDLTVIPLPRVARTWEISERREPAIVFRPTPRRRHKGRATIVRSPFGFERRVGVTMA